MANQANLQLHLDPRDLDDLDRLAWNCQPRQTRAGLVRIILATAMRYYRTHSSMMHYRDDHEAVFQRFDLFCKVHHLKYDDGLTELMNHYGWVAPAKPYAIDPSIGNNPFTPGN